MDWIYQIPTVYSFIIFIIIVVILALVGLYFFKLLNLVQLQCKEHTAALGIFVGLVSVFLGVIISFLVITTWGNFSSSQLNDQREAQALYNLYLAVSILPGTENIQLLIIAYLEYIINIEFPALNQGTLQPEEGNRLIEQLQKEMYTYNPTNQQQIVLYNNSITLLTAALDLRIQRVHNATQGLFGPIFWTAILDAILLIIMTWFLRCEGIFHYLLVGVSAIYVGAGLFLIIILTYPYLGYSGLPPTPYQEALTEIMALRAPPV